MNWKALFLVFFILLIVIGSFILFVHLFKESDLTTKYVESEGEYVNLSNVEECSENWECSDFGPCINYVKKRVCVDQNACSEELSKIEIEVCSSSGSISYDLNSSGNDSFIPETEQNSFVEDSFGEEGSFVDCGSEKGTYINGCFVEASLECNKSILENEYSVESYGVIITSKTLFKLVQYEGKCMFSEELTQISLIYGPELTQEFLDAGYSQEYIDGEVALENLVLEKFVGTWVECLFESEDLSGILNEWINGNLDSRAECFFDGGDNFLCEYVEDYLKGSCRNGI